MKSISGSSTALNARYSALTSITPLHASALKPEVRFATSLPLRSGSCRDIAALFIAAVRHLGFGARAVSGYLADPSMQDGDGGSTHAWAEVFLPEILRVRRRRGVAPGSRLAFLAGHDR